MGSALKLSIEERLLHKIIFTNKKVYRYEFKNIDYRVFIKIGSSHFLLPLIYNKLEKKEILKFLPIDLKIYLKEIFDINKERNNVLVDEIDTLSKFLKAGNLYFLFLKGSNNILNNIYENNAERMISDIDFLINKSDLNKVEKLLNKQGYFNKFNYRIWKTKHPPKYINNKKLFSLEPHTELLIYRKRNYLSAKEYIKNINLGAGSEYLIKYLILNHQINDYNHLYGNYNLRSIYDIHLLINNQKIEIENYRNKYFKRFFLITNLLGITNLKIKTNFLDKIYVARFKLKKSIFLYHLLDRFLCDIIRYLPIRIMQFVEFALNKDYRGRILSK